MPKYLAFDIGIRNLAYSIITYSNNTVTINDLDVIDLKPPKLCEICNCKAKYKYHVDKFCCGRHKQDGCVPWKEPKLKWDTFELSSKLYNQLNLRPQMLDNVDGVLLENQPVTMNPHLKTVQILIFGYFVNNGIKMVKNINAKNKFYVIEKDKKKIPKDYRDRKKLAIQHAKTWLCNVDCKEHVEIFDKHSKKDDLADALLLNAWWSER